MEYPFKIIPMPVPDQLEVCRTNLAGLKKHLDEVLTPQLNLFPEMIQEEYLIIKTKIEFFTSLQRVLWDYQFIKENLVGQTPADTFFTPPP